MTYIYIFAGFFVFILFAILIDEILYRVKINKRIKSSDNQQRYGKSSNTKWWDR